MPRREASRGERTLNRSASILAVVYGAVKLCQGEKVNQEFEFPTHYHTTVVIRFLIDVSV